MVIMYVLRDWHQLTKSDLKVKIEGYFRHPSLPCIIHNWDPEACPMAKIFPRTAGFCLSFDTFLLYFHTQIILTLCILAILPIHLDYKVFEKKTTSSPSTTTLAQELVQHGVSALVKDFKQCQWWSFTI